MQKWFICGLIQSELGGYCFYPVAKNICFERYCWFLLRFLKQVSICLWNLQPCFFTRFDFWLIFENIGGSTRCITESRFNWLVCVLLILRSPSKRVLSANKWRSCMRYNIFRSSLNMGHISLTDTVHTVSILRFPLYHRRQSWILRGQLRGNSKHMVAVMVR